MNKVTGFIFKPSRLKKGRKVKSLFFVLRLKIDGKAIGKDIPLHVRDNQVAEKMKAEFLREKERELGGILETKPLRDAAQKPLCDHLVDFVADLLSRKKDGHYVDVLETHLSKLFKECNWRLPRDITSDTFIAWRSKQSFAAKTKHHYQIDCGNFLNWMRRNGRAKSNPLEFVGKIELRGNEVLKRRQFTVEEVKRLAAVSGPRWVVYLTAVNTGLRRGELAQLQKADVHLYGERPFILVRASTTKNHKAAPLWLNQELACELKKLVGVGENGAALVFERIPRMEQFKRDLVAAKISYKDEHDRVADFHALRHTLATNLADAGIHPGIAKAILRHSDIGLTMGTYTHTSALALAEAVEKLPTFGSAKVNTPRNAPILVKSSPTVSSDVCLSVSEKSEKPIDTTGESPSLSVVVPFCPELEMVRGAGFEPATPCV
jgi:integrase